MHKIKINHLTWVALITITVFFATLLVTPDWLVPYKPVSNLIISAFAGAVTFYAAWRKAVESGSSNRSGSINAITTIQGSNIAGRDNIHVVNNVYQNTSTAQEGAGEDIRTIVSGFNERIVKAHQTWGLYTRRLIRADEPPLPSRSDVADSMNALVDYLNANGYLLSTPLRQDISNLLMLFRRAWDAREMALSLAPFQAAGHRESGLQAAKFHDDAASIIVNDVPPLIERIKTQLREARGFVGPAVSILAQVDVSRTSLPSNIGTVVVLQHRNLFVRVVNHNRDYPLNVDTLRFVPTAATAIVLQPFHILYDNLPPKKFTVPPDRNEIFVAHGQKLAEGLRAAGCEGEVAGRVELEEENGTKWYSDQLAISVSQLGLIQQPNMPI